MNQFKKFKNRKERRPNNKLVSRILIALLTFAVLFLLLTTTAAPKKHNIAVGEIAEESIKAPREIEDEYTTDNLKRDARNGVRDKYIQDDTITLSVINDLDDCIAAMEQVRQKGMDERLRQQQDAGTTNISVVFTAAFVDEMRKLLPSGFTDGDIHTILDSEKEKLAEVTGGLRTLIQDAMKGGIKENVRDDQVTSISHQFMMLGYKESINNLGRNIISTYLRANFIYDAAATEAAKAQAEEAVEPVVYKTGQIIVEEGKPVTQTQYEILRQLGMVDDETNGWYENLAILCVLAIIFASSGWYLARYHREVFTNAKILLVICAVTVLTLLITFGTSYIQYYIIPIPLAAVIITLVMLDYGVALFINAMVAIMAGIMSLRFGASIALSVTVSSMVAGFVSIFAIKKIPQRASLMLSGLAAGGAAAIVYTVFDLMEHNSWMDILYHGGMGLVSGLVATVLAIGTLPLWEWAFKLVTPMKLLELTNPNQPLLKQLLMEAPGTYHHSIMVGNMAERAAEAIGANPLIVRAGAYYHDIGKLKRPYFFKENQSADNPHDNIQPDLSTRIITSHVNDGLDMVKKQKLPKVIQDIVAEHHGDTPVMYFYMKEKQQSEEPDKVNIDDYRYRGMRPHTRESAIILLADSVEAAVRSMDKPTADSVDEMIKKIVKSKLDDGQLDYCDITLKEIHTVIRAFRGALAGVFHERIEYPEKDET